MDTMLVLNVALPLYLHTFCTAALQPRASPNEADHVIFLFAQVVEPYRPKLALGPTCDALKAPPFNSQSFRVCKEGRGSDVTFLVQGDGVRVGTRIQRSSFDLGR